MRVCGIVLWLMALTMGGYATPRVFPVSDHVAIQVTDFSSNTVSQTVWQQLREYDTDTPIPILVDLRDNSGGYLHDALRLSATFVMQSELIDLQGPSSTITVTRPEWHPYFRASSIIILVNKNTASAAEACAYVLSHHPNATIVGEASKGKVTLSLDSPDSSDHAPIQFTLPQKKIIPDVPLLVSSTDELDDVYRFVLRMVAIQ